MAINTMCLCTIQYNVWLAIKYINTIPINTCVCNIQAYVAIQYNTNTININGCV